MIMFQVSCRLICSERGEGILICRGLRENTVISPGLEGEVTAVQQPQPSLFGWSGLEMSSLKCLRRVFQPATLIICMR